MRPWPLIAVPWALVPAPAECRAEAMPPAQFTWQRGAGAEGCLSEPELRAKIADALGADPFSKSHGPVVLADATARGDELVATVRLRESENAPEAFREIHAPAGDCTALTDAVALAVTLALSSTERPKPDEVLVVSPPPAPADRGTIGPAPRSAPGTWAVLAEAVWTLGALPRPEAGVGVEARYAIFPRWAITVGGDWLPDASEAGQFSVGLARGRFGLCTVPFRHGSFSVLGCATAEGGAVRVRNEAATLATAGSHAWFGAGLSARASARLGERWVVEGGAGAVVPTSRPIYATPSCPLVGFQQPAATFAVLITTGMLF